MAVTVDGHEYRARNGYFDVDNDRHASGILQAGGYGKAWQVATPVAPSLGYRCPECGHGSYFRVCGVCGTECVRETA